MNIQEHFAMYKFIITTHESHSSKHNCILRNSINNIMTRHCVLNDNSNLISIVNINDCYFRMYLCLWQDIYHQNTEYCNIITELRSTDPPAYCNE